MQETSSSSRPRSVERTDAEHARNDGCDQVPARKELISYFYVEGIWHILVQPLD